MSGKKTARKAELNPAEWDFSSVPEKELPACFLWEYARENAWVMKLAKRCKEHPLLTPEGEAYFEALEREFSKPDTQPQIRVPKWREDFETPEGIRWMGDLLKVSMGKFPDYVDRTLKFFLSEWIQDAEIMTPWQLLPEESRAVVIRSAADCDAACHKPIISSEDFDCPDGVYSYLGKRLKGRTILDPRNEFQGVHTLLISWETYSNKQIVDSFCEWLNERREIHPCKSSGKGNKLEDRRAWLKWLGVMRALHCFTFADYRFPEALRCGGDSRKVYAMRTKARAKFRELFGSLPGKDDPISFPTAGKSP